jgi:hypothetical protein
VSSRANNNIIQADFEQPLLLWFESILESLVFLKSLFVQNALMIDVRWYNIA